MAPPHPRRARSRSARLRPRSQPPAASPSSVTYGGSVTLTQAVPAGATGTVTFASGATVLGTATISNGVATLTTTTIPGGTSPVTGFYSGNNNYTSALSAATNVTVTPVPVLAALGASPTGGPYGTPITLTQVMPTGATGTVTFTANGVTLGTATIVNGVATLTTTSIPAGANTTIRAFPGSGNYTAANFAPTTVTITQAIPVLPGTSLSPATAPFGSPVSITQAVPQGATGTVTFLSGGVTLGTATIVNGPTVLGTANIVNGVATLIITTIPGGNSPVVGMYNGNNNFAPVASIPASVVMTPAVPALASPGASPTGGPYGTAVTLTQAMPPARPERSPLPQTASCSAREPSSTASLP